MTILDRKAGSKNFLLTAKSTRCSFPTLTCCCPSGPFSLHSMVTVNIACERELCRFMLVAPVTPMKPKKSCIRPDNRTLCLTFYHIVKETELATTLHNRVHYYCISSVTRQRFDFISKQSQISRSCDRSRFFGLFRMDG